MKPDRRIEKIKKTMTCFVCEKDKEGRIYQFKYGTENLEERRILGVEETFICDSCLDEYYEREEIRHARDNMKLIGGGCLGVPLVSGIILFLVFTVGKLLGLTGEENKETFWYIFYGISALGVFFGLLHDLFVEVFFKKYIGKPYTNDPDALDNFVQMLGGKYSGELKTKEIEKELGHSIQWWISSRF